MCNYLPRALFRLVIIICPDHSEIYGQVRRTKCRPGLGNRSVGQHDHNNCGLWYPYITYVTIYSSWVHNATNLIRGPALCIYIYILYIVYLYLYIPIYTFYIYGRVLQLVKEQQPTLISVSKIIHSSLYFRYIHTFMSTYLYTYIYIYTHTYGHVL